MKATTPIQGIPPIVAVFSVGVPSRLILALVVAALLCVGGMRFWNYLQSYEWTDDAEIDGHLDPISTRINDTVVRVYVENTYHVKAGQPLVDLDPRDYQVAVENAAANLAQAEQGVKAAQQNYELSVANLDAAIATNVKAQLDVKRYGELLEQAVIPRETDDEIVMTGRVDAAAVNSDRAAVGAAAQNDRPGPGRGASRAGFAGSGQAQPELYAYRRARHRSGRQQDGAGRPARATRRATAYSRSSQRYLDHR